MDYFALLLALLWGVLWAACLQFVPLGRFLATRRTWITVVIGVGVDLLICLLIFPLETVLRLAPIFAISSIGIIVRSLYNELHDEQAVTEVFDGHQDARAQ